MEHFRQILEILILILDGFSILVLLWGVISAAKGFVVSRIVNKSGMDVIKENTIVKNALGSYILLSLEILIAADIIKTVLDPGLNDVLILAALVLIRTFISFFLNKELKDQDKGTNNKNEKFKNQK